MIRVKCIENVDIVEDSNTSYKGFTEGKEYDAEMQDGFLASFDDKDQLTHIYFDGIEEWFDNHFEVIEGVLT